MILATKGTSILRFTCLAACKQSVDKSLCLHKRFFLTGSPFPQTPAPGDLQWKDILKNIKLHKEQPSLFPAEIKREQEIREMEKSIAQIKEILSKIMEKNKAIYRPM